MSAKDCAHDSSGGSGLIRLSLERMAHSGRPTLIARGLGATPGEIMALPLMRLQITSYQRDQQIIQAMDEQPLPGAAAAVVA
jgi:hypothetical protein